MESKRETPSEVNLMVDDLVVEDKKETYGIASNTVLIITNTSGISDASSQAPSELFIKYVNTLTWKQHINYPQTFVHGTPLLV